VNKHYSAILVIPCYNEAKRLDLPSYREFLSAHPDFFLVFVDDGSHDNTQTILDAAGMAFGNYIILRQEKNTGKGEAVRKGMKYCFKNYDFDFIGYADADLSTPLSEFISFRNEMNNDPGIKIVMGSRVQMLGKTIKRRLFRHWFSRVIATAICKVLDEPVYDTQCGAKLFTRQVSEFLFKEKFISKWLFDVELLARFKKEFGSASFKTCIREYPVKEWTEKPDSKMRYHYIFRILADLLKIRKHYFRKK
jgi:dolichyl-phosphate beta-glucosyltransferase